MVLNLASCVCSYGKKKREENTKRILIFKLRWDCKIIEASGQCDGYLYHGVGPDVF